MSPHSLFVHESGTVAPGKTILSWCFIRWHNLGSQHTVDYAYAIDYAYNVNYAPTARAPHSYFLPYPKYTFCGEWVVYAGRSHVSSCKNAIIIIISLYLLPTEKPVDNSRYACLQFTSNTATTLHGFAGYFDTNLYDGIMLSKLEPICLFL